MSLVGEIRTMPVQDLLRWVELKQKSGILHLECGPSLHRFSFSNGLISGALSGDHPGESTEEDVRRLLGESVHWTDGRFEFVEGGVPAGSTLRLSGKHLLIDTLRELDGSDRDHVPGRNGREGGTSLAEKLRFAVIDRLLLGGFQVPLLPTVVGRVLEVTRRGDFSMRELSTVILVDQSITASLLKQANSAFYGTSQEVDSVHDAVRVLGSQAVVNIVLSLALGSLTRGLAKFERFRASVWKRALFCALAARTLAKIKKLDADLAYLCGLMMDFGKMVVLTSVEELIDQEPDYENVSVENVEEILEAFHLHVGGIVGEKWRLPKAVVESMSGHHHVEAASEELVPYIACASVADSLAEHFTAGSDVDKPKEEMLRIAGLIASLPAGDLLQLSPEDAKRITAAGPLCQRYMNEILA